MIADSQKLVIVDLARALYRSWWTVVAGGCIGLSVAIVAFKHAPVVFEATISILVDASRLPDEFIRPTISDEGLELKLRELRDAVFTDENLARVVEVGYPGTLTPENVLHLSSGISRRTSVNYFPRTKSIVLSFTDTKPERAAAIVDEVADLFVRENVRLRSKDASKLTESVEKLAMDAEFELKALKEEMDDVRRRHPFETDEQRANNERVIQELQKDLEANREASRLAELRVRTLEAQQAFGRAGDGGTVGDDDSGLGGPSTGSAAPDAARLQQELAALLLRYSPDHPSVRAKQRELDVLLTPPETRPDDVEPPEVVEGGAPPTLDIWETQIRAARLQVTQLEQRSQELSRRLAQHRTYLASTPVIQRQIDDLNARISIKRKEQLENDAKIARSRQGELIEQQELGNPFVKLYDAVPPSSPISPDPIQFLVIGLAAGIALFVGPVAAKPFLIPLISSELALETLAKVPVLVSVPNLNTSESLSARRRGWVRNIGLSVVSVLLLVTVIGLDRIGVL